MANAHAKDNDVDELDIRLTARGLINYSRDFYNSYLIVQRSEPKELSLYQVKYYLLCHSIELALKAYLRLKGKTRRELIGFKHDLEKIVRECHKLGLVTDLPTIEKTLILNDYYKTKQFEYPQTGYKSLPSLKEMENSTDMMIRFISHKIDGVILKSIKERDSSL